MGAGENILPRRDKVTGEWRKMHNEELHDPYSLPNIIPVIKSRRPRHRWEDNIKMDLQEMGWGTWTGLIWLMTGTDGRHL